MNFNCVFSCKTRRLPCIFFFVCNWSASSNLGPCLFESIMERWSVWSYALLVSSDVRMARGGKPICQSLRIIGSGCACCRNTTLLLRLVIELLATTHQLFICCIECINSVAMITASFRSWSRKTDFINLFGSAISLDSPRFKFFNDFFPLSFRVTASNHYLSFSSAHTSNIILLRIQFYHMMILKERLLKFSIV